MTDPVRWSDAGDEASEIEQSLMRSTQDLPMPHGEKTLVWNNIMAALPQSALTMPGQSQPTTFKGAMPLVRVGKALSVAALATGVALLGHQHGRRPSRHPEERGVAPNSSVSVEVVVSPSGAAVETAAEPVSSAPQASTSPSSGPAAQPSRGRLLDSSPPNSTTSQLREERQALLTARQALRSGSVRQALQILASAEERFRPGTLNEERAALYIEALARSGNRQEAQARARAFLKYYPKSPHAIDVQRTLAP